MKRIFTKALCLVCAGALALSLAACGGKADSAASSTASSSALGSASDYDYQNFNYSDGLDEKGYWEGIRALDYVTLPEDFASVAIKRSDVEPTSEEVEEQISDLLSQYSSTEHITDRAAADGDTVNINYAGMLDGIPFDGGTAENQNLVLGSNTFVPGFESQLVGISAGEERDLDITFPENYGHDLGGKAVVFHVKCNEVKFEELPELDDEFAKDNDFDTLADLKADIRAKSVEEKEKAAKNAFDDALVDQAVENMTVDMPEGMIEERMDGIVREYAQYMANQGIRIDDYLKMIGTDMKTFRESMRATAEKQARTEVLLAAVAEAENVQISEEDLQAEYEKLGEAYGMKAEDVAKAIDVAGLTADLRRERAMSIISESGVAVEKKAEEPAKTEEASKAKKKPAAKKAAKTEETEGEEAPKAKKTTRKTTKKAAAKKDEEPKEEEKGE